MLVTVHFYSSYTACDCVRGECVEAYYKGYGECRCDAGVHGTNCDRQDTFCQDTVSNPWSFLGFITCHIHAQCIVFSDDTYRCVCKPGYEGPGDACTEVDPCETNRGGCHLQATCRKTGPGVAECHCNSGFKGDGHFCYLETECWMHTDCHQNARCMSTARGQYVCQCLDGFYGNGTSCWYDDKCKINNGGCHSHAKCVHGDRFDDNVTCTCYTELGYYGDGYHCKPSIMRIIQEHPRLTKMAAMMKKLKEVSINLDIWESGEHTVFAWTDRVVEQAEIVILKAQENNLGTRHILTILKAHTVQGRHSLDYLAAVSSVTQLHSLLDGFSFFVTKDNGTFSVMLRRTGRVTTVESHDLEASNGYLNIIDEILFPGLDTHHSSTNQDIYAEWKNLTDTHNISWSMKDPTLTGFMEDYPNYSTFMNSLKMKNLTSMLEKDDFPFTLFVPSNEYMKHVNRTVTRDFLRYYIVPEARMMWSMSDRDTMITDLGYNHQLQIQWSENKPFVNGVPVLKHDIFLSGGMLNLIDGLLHPNLSWCEVDYTHVEMGPCTVCTRKLYTCFDGLKPAAYGNALPCRYEEHGADGDVWKAGCQGLCVTQKNHRDCCAGHYGDTCQECPGGPELPCSGHGQCNSGTTGDGKCMCERSFVGQTCDSCITGFTGPDCNIDMSGCAYKNGGCHKDAKCTRGNSDVISCKCMKGFSGNGYSCTGPCDDNNGGCHRDATCKYTFQTDVKCKCNAEFVGDGKSYCMSSLYSSLSSLPDAHWFYKSLISMTDKTLVTKLNSTTVTHKFTVFVPKDGSLNTMMSKETVLQQIVMSSEGLVLNPTDFTNVSLYTLSNQSVVVSYDPSQRMFYVNNTKILSPNIKFTNGIVHIVQHPFTPPTESSQGLPVGVVVGTVICVLLLGLIVGVGIVVYRQSKTGYWSSLNKWLVRRETSSGVDNVPLHMDEEDSNHHHSGLPATTNFDNPAFITESQ